MVRTKKAVNTESKLLKLFNDPKRFKIQKDGWIKDSLLGLDWGPSSDKSMTFKDAVAYCEERHARLPEVQELYSIIDTSKKDHCIKDAFKDVQDSYYWTNTPVAWTSSPARWVVGFYDGNVNRYYENRYDFVRPVRPSQC